MVNLFNRRERKKERDSKSIMGDIKVRKGGEKAKKKEK